MPGVSSAEQRKFGLTVGAAFAVLGGVSWARGHDTAPLVLWTLASVLVVLGLVAPRLLGPVRRVWMHGAMLLGELNSRIILTVLFYTLFAPLGWVRRRWFGDPLTRSLDEAQSSYWIKRTPGPVDPARYQRQF